MRRIITAQNSVYIIAAFLSAILSCWINSRLVVINPDAICYLQSAAMVKQGLSAVVSLCDQSAWPFYQVLIAAISGVTQVSYEHAAFLLNGVFSLFTVLVFIRIVAFFTANQRILWLAGGVILCSHEWNVFKQDVIRDHGFWCFYLLSILCLLQYFKQHTWRYALGWMASVMIAALFRIEGALFVLLIPLLVWFQSQYAWSARLRAFLQLNAGALLAAVAIGAVLIVHPGAALTRLSELAAHLNVSHFYTHVIEHYTELADTLGRTVLGRSAGDRYEIYFLMMLASYVVVLVSTLSLVYALIVIYAWFCRALLLPTDAKIILGGYVTLNVMITLIFLFENQFLSKRYLFALALTLIIWVPFGLNDLLQRWQKKSWLSVLLMLIIVYSGVSGVLHYQYAKQYIRAAGDWLAEHAPANAVIYSNDYQVMYYSQHFGNNIFVKQREQADLNVLRDGRWKQYDYLALKLNRESLAAQAILLQEMTGLPVVIFKGKRDGDQIRIYRRS